MPQDPHRATLYHVNMFAFADCFSYLCVHCHRVWYPDHNKTGLFIMGTSSIFTLELLYSYLHLFFQGLFCFNKIKGGRGSG